MSAAVIAVLSILVGGGVAAAAVSAVVASAAPNDTQAVQTGPSATVAPSAVIKYGG